MFVFIRTNSTKQCEFLRSIGDLVKSLQPNEQRVFRELWKSFNPLVFRKQNQEVRMGQWV